ncbi:ATP-binding protein [Quadrisphaera sp. INWT6]|uniref:ATP-binding protein n=1 Tax=Quadrisphaera sp. INWT6 TaxID=2596917 RepID=UPI0018922B5A|nr:ATP-binding protein [Quadrisphaera sp. INWT6]MBF5082351.1 ATP-binding protein [Quadrisphaera sp. INWT6]
MNAPAMATGSLPAARVGLGLMTYPPKIAAVRQARRYVRDAVATSATPTLAEDAALLVAELAVNAVLHARTDFDVAVEGTANGVRVSVRDRSPAMPVLVAPQATAMSGRGLALVAALASRWGAGPSASATKSVWFELSGEGADPSSAPSRAASTGARDGGEGMKAALAEALSTEGLLAACSDEADDLRASVFSSALASMSTSMSTVTGLVAAGAGGVSRCASGVEVVLPALDAADLLGAEEAMQDVLRELQLILLSDTSTSGQGSHGSKDSKVGLGGQATADTGRGGPRSRENAGHRAEHPAEHLAGHWAGHETEVAYRLDRAARGFADVRAQVRQQVIRAVAVGQQYVALRLVLAPGAGRRASAFAAALEAAEELTARGGLLSAADALSRHRAVRRAYLLEVAAAAACL